MRINSSEINPFPDMLCTLDGDGAVRMDLCDQIGAMTPWSKFAGVDLLNVDLISGLVIIVSSFCILSPQVLVD